LTKGFWILATPRIIINYKGRATLAQAFAEVERYGRALYQHDATNMVSWMIDSTKPRKVALATNSLAETESEKS